MAVKFYADNHITIYQGDCRSMSELPDEAVQCVVTSPPYWGLRKYSGEQELIWGDSTYTHITGGEYAACVVEIVYDPNLSYKVLRSLIIHAIIEQYLGCLTHDKVEQLEGYIQEGLDQLDDMLEADKSDGN